METKIRKFRKSYTKKQSKEIYDLWYVKKGNTAEKKQLSLRLNREVNALAQKAYSMQQARDKKSTPIKKEIEVSEVIVTHLDKKRPESEKAVITIDGAKIELPSNSFMINGVKVAW